MTLYQSSSGYGVGEKMKSYSYLVFYIRGINRRRRFAAALGLIQQSIETRLYYAFIAHRRCVFLLGRLTTEPLNGFGGELSHIVRYHAEIF